MRTGHTLASQALRSLPSSPAASSLPANAAVSRPSSLARPIADSRLPSGAFPRHPDVSPMPTFFSLIARLGSAAAALLLAAVPMSSAVHPQTTRTSMASEGAVARELAPAAAARARAAVRKQLEARGQGTYINQMLAERDSSLARWKDQNGVPLRIWIQPTSDVKEWRSTFTTEVRDAFIEWDSLSLPVRFSFTADSASADVHVTFI